MKLSANVRNLLNGKTIVTKQDILDDLSARIEKGSQVQVANEIGISDAYLSDIKRGARGNVMLSNEVAEKLGYDVVVLYLRKDAK